MNKHDVNKTYCIRFIYMKNTCVYQIKACGLIKSVLDKY